MLNLGQLLGSGIFAVPGIVLDSVGSVGLSLSLWIISPIFALCAWHSFSDVLLLICFHFQSRCFPILNLLVSFPDALARRLYFSSTLTHAQGSLCRLRLLSLPYFSRACILCGGLSWAASSLLVISFSAGNSIVFAQYTLTFFNLPITDLSQTVLAIGVVTFSVAGRSPKQPPIHLSYLISSCRHLHQMGTQSRECTEFIQGSIPSIVSCFMSV